MKKIILMAGVMAILILHGFAQSDQVSGYIVNLQSDTLHGIIDLKAASKSNTICRFKTETQWYEYSVHDIAAFGAGSRLFVAWPNEGIFAEILIRGSLSLYISPGAFWLQKQEEIFRVEPHRRRPESGTARETSPRWMGVLSLMTADCPGLKEDIAKLKSTERELLGFVKAYNSCINNPFTEYKTDIPWILLSPGISTGISRNNLIAKRMARGGEEFIHLSDNYYTLSQNFGIQLTTSFPRFHQNISLLTEINYMQSEYSSSVTYDRNRRNFYHDTHIQISSIAIPIALQYKILGGPLPVFAHIGFSVISNFKSSSLATSEVLWDNYTVYNTQQEALPINKNELGFLTGITAHYPLPGFSLGVGARYQSEMINNSNSLASYVNKLSLNLILKLR